MARLILSPAQYGGIHFTRDHEKLSSRFHPRKEAIRLLWSYLRDSSQPLSERPVLFIGLFPLYQIVFYLQHCYGKYSLAEISLAAQKKDVHEEEILLLKKPVATQKITTIAILESRRLAQDDIQKALTAIGLTEFFWQNIIIKHRITQGQAWTAFFSLLNANDQKSPLIIESPYALHEDRLAFRENFRRWKELTIKTHSTHAYFSSLWKTNIATTLCHRQEKKLAFINTLRINTQGQQTSQATAIAIFSGLSTERQLETIRHQARDYPVYSLPGLYPWLREMSIRLTALVSTDPGYYNRIHFYWERMKQYPPPLLIAPLTLAPSITRHYEDHGKIVYYIDDHELLRAWQQEATLGDGTPLFIPMDASVSLSMIRLLAHLGYKRILTYGADFSHTPFKAHMTSYPLEELCFSQHQRLSSADTQIQVLFQKLQHKKDHQTKLPPPATSEHSPQHPSPFPYSDPKLLLYEQAFLNLQRNLWQNKGIEIQRGETFHEPVKQHKKAMFSPHEHLKLTTKPKIPQYKLKIILKKYLNFSTTLAYNKENSTWSHLNPSSLRELWHKQRIQRQFCD